MNDVDVLDSLRYPNCLNVLENLGVASEAKCAIFCLCCICVLQVVWDDSILRLFVVPTGNRPLGLLYRANKGQVDFDGAVGRWGCNSPWLLSSNLFSKEPVAFK